ncbi:MAG: hypothetical protein V5A34_10090 [Halapricum sp.]
MSVANRALDPLTPPEGIRGRETQERHLAMLCPAVLALRSRGIRLEGGSRIDVWNRPSTATTAGTKALFRA